MLNYYIPFYSTRQGRHCPGVSAQELTKEKFYELTRSEEVKKLIASFRNGDAEAKQKLPAVCWTGTLPNAIVSAHHGCSSPYHPSPLPMADFHLAWVYTSIFKQQ